MKLLVVESLGMRLPEHTIIFIFNWHSSFTLQIDLVTAAIGTITIIEYEEIPIDTSICYEDGDGNGGKQSMNLAAQS